MTLQIEDVQSRIPELRQAIKMERIEKGFSPVDQKYMIILDSGKKLLLRTGAMAQAARKQALHQVLQDLQSYGAQSPLSLATGTWEDLDLCYQLLSYLEGEDVQELLPHLSEGEQYRIGFDAGRDLAKMHRLPAPPTEMRWYERTTCKHRRYVDAYQTCGVKIADDQRILAFIEENEPILRKRPTQFQHDDFHVGNLIVQDKRYAGVIDFNNFDWGDPIHDFYKIAWLNREASVPFSVGQLHGYFENGSVPAEFWRLYAVYVAMSVFSTVVWSSRYTPHMLDAEIQRLYRVVEDHKGFELLEPTWYQEGWTFR